MTLEQTINTIRPVSRSAAAQAQARWDSIAKPLNGLGLLESAVCRLAGAQRAAEVDITRRALVVFCADNGVVEEGVSQSGCEVTEAVARNLCANQATVCHMARLAGCDVIPVDVGMRRDMRHPGLRQAKAACGTGNITKGPAMTRKQAVVTMEAGAAQALRCGEQGYRLLLAGEMGIGNTATSSAAASVLCGRPPEEVTGRGAGLSGEGLERKIRAIQTAVACNRPDPRDPVDVLAKVGGFDLAALCGFYLGCAAAGLPVVLDGLISCTAALCASRLCPDSAGYMIASHASAEPAAGLLLESLGLAPILSAGMRLGEGSGAVAALPLLDMALAVYRNGLTFYESGLEPYRSQEQSCAR